MNQGASRLQLIPIRWLGVFLLAPLDGMLVQCRVTPSIKVVVTHLYTWMERNNVSNVSQEHNRMSPARVWTCITWSRVKHTNHEAITPFSFFIIIFKANLIPFSLIYSKRKNNLFTQGSCRSWKTWKVMEFYNFIFQAWKVLKFRCGSWKVIENQYDLYKWKAIRSKVEKLTDKS